MGGEVAVLDIKTGAVLSSMKAHQKYVVAVRWSPDGRYLATASYDQSLTIHKLLLPATADGCASREGSVQSTMFEKVCQVNFRPLCSDG